MYPDGKFQTDIRIFRISVSALLTIHYALKIVILGHAQKCITPFYNEVVVLLSMQSSLTL